MYTETSSLITLKIMPRNLNEIVRSWIRLQDIQLIQQELNISLRWFKIIQPEVYVRTFRLCWHNEICKKLYVKVVELHLASS
jgi:hypothetical protein